RSSTTTSSPERSSDAAQARPAGPAPTTAITTGFLHQVNRRGLLPVWTFLGLDTERGENMRRSLLRLALVAAVSTLTLAAAAPLSAPPPDGSYTVTPLVSDVPGAAAITDPNLVNAWGLTRSPSSPWWVADNGKDKSTLYSSNGTTISIVPLVVGVDG